MDLQIIKSYCEKRIGGLKQLAEDANMSEANLHRCIRLNRMQASDLEKIASLLNIKVGTFFGESSANDYAPSISQSNNGNSNVLVGRDNNGRINVSECQDKLDDAMLEIKHLKERLKDKEEMIEILKSQLNK